MWTGYCCRPSSLPLPSYAIAVIGLGRGAAQRSRRLSEAGRVAVTPAEHFFSLCPECPYLRVHLVAASCLGAVARGPQRAEVEAVHHPVAGRLRTV